MKNIALLRITILFIGFSFTNSELFSQDVPNVDPRQYIKVLYRKNLNSTPDIIWDWKNEKRDTIEEKNLFLNSLGTQHFSYIDKGGTINIVFDKDGLANNEELIGMLSLEASINSSDGERSIEVNPYSTIGKEREVVGINSANGKDLAFLVVTLIRELYSIREKWYETSSIMGRSITFDHIQSAKEKKYKTKLKNGLDSILNSKTPTKTIQNLTKEILEDILENIGVYDDSWRYYFYDEKNKKLVYSNPDFSDSYERPNINKKDTSIYGQIEFFRKDNYSDTSKIKNFLDVLKTTVNRDLNYLTNRIRTRKSRYLEDLEELLEYAERIKHFNKIVLNSGKDGRVAVLKLLGKDSILVRRLPKKLNAEIDKLSNFLIKSCGKKRLLPTMLDEAEFDERFNGEIEASRAQLLKLLMHYLYFEGTPFFDILVNIKKESSKDIDKDDFGLIQTDDILFRDLEFKLLLKDSSARILKEVTRFINQQVYKKLLYATIDLKKEDAKNGDILYIKLKWEGYGQNKELPPLPIICKFHLKETGWKVKVSESFLLVERINEESPNVNPQTSPSNFKGAPGASLMWSYYKEESTKTKCKNWYKFFNFLQPSFGINLSYIDFHTQKDFELGIGGQIGFFANNIFLGYGVNVHQIREGGNPTYFSVGFNFINIAQTIVDLKNKN